MYVMCVKMTKSQITKLKIIFFNIIFTLEFRFYVMYEFNFCFFVFFFFFFFIVFFCDYFVTTPFNSAPLIKTKTYTIVYDKVENYNFILLLLLCCCSCPNMVM